MAKPSKVQATNKECLMMDAFCAMAMSLEEVCWFVAAISDAVALYAGLSIIPIAYGSELSKKLTPAPLLNENEISRRYGYSSN